MVDLFSIALDLDSRARTRYRYKPIVQNIPARLIGCRLQLFGTVK